MTPIQMVQAFTSVTNNGEVLKPYIVKKVVDPVTNKVILENNRTVIGKVASITTTEKVIDLLDGVVNLDSEGSSGYKYKTDKVRTIGKTGTAEIASENGGYLTGSINYVRSFLGAFPYDDPQIIVYMAVSKITDTTLPGKATRQLIDDVSTYLGIVKQNKNEYSNFKLTSYINQDVIKTTEELKSKNLDVVIIGDGSRIINQYPKSNSIVNANEKVFLVTNGTNYKYTNIENWSRSELDIYSKLLGVNFNYTGYGYSYGTDLKNRDVVKGETIDINLKVKYLEKEEKEEKESNTDKTTENDT